MRAGWEPMSVLGRRMFCAMAWLKRHCSHCSSIAPVLFVHTHASFVPHVCIRAGGSVKERGTTGLHAAGSGERGTGNGTHAELLCGCAALARALPGQARRDKQTTR